MLTFESADDGSKLEVHGDKEGFLKLAKILTDMANENSAQHVHLMTDDWGGSGLSNEKQGLDNTLYHHVKLFVWPEDSK